MRYCPNVSCPGRVLESIVHFASRDAMDIRGLGYERVRQLLDTGLIENVADLYDITVRAAGRAGALRQAVGRAAGRRHRRLEAAAALVPALRARHPARGQDGRGAAGPEVRQHGGADGGGRAGRHRRRAGHRAHDRGGGDGILRRAAGTGLLVERLEKAGLTLKPSPTPPGGAARSRDRPT